MLFAFLVSFSASDVMIYDSEPELSPRFRQLDFVAGDVLFDGKLVLPDGDLERWPNPRLNDVRGPDFGHPPRPTCEVPGWEGAADRQPYALICSDSEAWFATEGYCVEGERAPGVIFRQRSGGRLESFPGWLPDCEYAVAAVRVAGELWLGTERPVEKYAPRVASGVLAYAVGDPDAESTQFLADQIITGMAYDAGREAVWVLSVAGIHRYHVNTGRWQQAYYRYFVGDDDSLRLGLGETEPSPAERIMYEYLRVLPIRGKREFLQRWQSLEEPPEQLGWTRSFPPELLPWYLDAAVYYREADDGQYELSDYVFSMLLEMILVHTREYGTLIAPAFQALSQQEHSLVERKMIWQGLKQLELPYAEYETALQFDRLLRSMTDDLMQWQHLSDREQYTALCGFVRRHPDYSPRLAAAFERDPPPKGAVVEACLAGKGVQYIEPVVKPRQRRQPGIKAEVISVDVQMLTEEEVDAIYRELRERKHPGVITPN